MKSLEREDEALDLGEPELHGKYPFHAPETLFQWEGAISKQEIAEVCRMLVRGWKAGGDAAIRAAYGPKGRTWT